MKKTKIIDTQSGRVQGYISNKGLHIFKGIPYARAPIGPLRFKPPEETKAWHSTLKATEFGPYCPQGFTLLEDSFGFFENQSEDNCLTLNIWAPESENDLRPVMVYIHGGSFIFGGGADIWYGVDGSELAQNEDVVVVTLNYRLGAFGFLYLEDQTANVGILDQIAVLKWIKKNIETFGGNPNNITIFGESAGGLSVLILTTIPLAKGLFQRAIIQSAPILDTKPTIRSTNKLFQELGIKVGDINGLRDLSFRKVLTAQNKIVNRWISEGENEIMDYRPSVDGEIIPMHPIDAIRKGLAKEIDILIGHNKDETKLWTALDPIKQNLEKKDLCAAILHRLGKFGDGKLGFNNELCETLVSLYSRESSEKSIEIYDRIDTDFTFGIPSTLICEGNYKHNPNIYRYIFTWPSPAYKGKYGSCHIVEIPFAFGTIGKTGAEWFFGAGEEAESISKKMMTSWVKFASTGNPNNDLIPEWNVYDVENRSTMFIGKEFRSVNAPNDEERSLWNSVLFNG